MDAIIGKKEKVLVLLDGSSHRPAVLIARIASSLRNAGQVRVKVVSRQLRPSVEQVTAAVKLVRAGFGHK